MRNFSQNNEQSIILAHFGAAQGTFLDLGSNDGITLSNTHALALLGWQGVCVEPAPSAFAKLEKLYADNPNIECHRLAVCDGNGLSILHESGPHLGNGDTALLSTIIPGEKDRWVSTNTKFIPTTVQCVTFGELLDMTVHRQFDLISIDIEGLDLEVLQQINLTDVGCKLLVVEVNDRDIDPYVTYCAEHGMRALTRNAENIVFVR